jgi:hypothetical protein
VITDRERAERARRFLRRLRADRDAAGAAELATDADVAPEEIDERYCAALDRVLVAWSVAEIEDVMRELGVDEVVLRRGGS